MPAEVAKRSRQPQRELCCWHSVHSAQLRTVVISELVGFCTAKCCCCCQILVVRVYLCCCAGGRSLLSWLTSSLTLMLCLRLESGAACTQVLVHFNLHFWVLNYRMQLQQRLRNQGTSTLVLQLQPCVPDRSPQGSCGRGHLQSISRWSKAL
jgi:hypothetical protein